MNKLKQILLDPLFYAILLDYLLTLIIINYGYGFEANGLVIFLGNGVSVLLSLLIYILFIEKDGLGFTRNILLIYYFILIFRHFMIIYGQ